MKFPKPTIIELSDVGQEDYVVKEVDVWREALRVELTKIIVNYRQEPFARPTIALLESLLEEWL